MDNIDGLELVEFIEEKIDCFNYITDLDHPRQLVPGVIEHSGKPEPGDLVIYGRNIKTPKHIGSYQEDGRVLSKWGDYGPVLLHELDQIPLFSFGNRTFFSTIK